LRVIQLMTKHKKLFINISVLIRKCWQELPHNKLRNTATAASQTALFSAAVQGRGISVLSRGK